MTLVDSSIQDNENNTESTNLSEKGSLDKILPKYNDLSFLQPQEIQGFVISYPWMTIGVMVKLISNTRS